MQLCNIIISFFFWFVLIVAFVYLVLLTCLNQKNILLIYLLHGLIFGTTMNIYIYIYSTASAFAQIQNLRKFVLIVK